MKRVVLVILDGWGLRRTADGNAIAIANTLHVDQLWNDNPHCTLKACGAHVGLRKHQPGTCAVGHENIGAGRIYDQELLTISKAIKDRTFFDNPVLVKAARTKGALHLVGLLSDAGLRSHIDHLLALIELAKKYQTKVFVHAILDGRDVADKSAKKYIKIVQKALKGAGQIATLSGRFYAMDEDSHWKRVERAYHVIMAGEGEYHEDPLQTLKAAYRQKETDELITPVIVGSEFSGVHENDAVFFFNFRPAGALQLARAFVDPDFDGFRRKKKFTGYFAAMVKYDTLAYDAAFTRPQLSKVLGEVLADAGVKQLRIAEAAKYKYVTYHLDNGRTEPFSGCDWVVIPSRQGSVSEHPEMSVAEVTQRVVREIAAQNYGFIVVNLANPDVLGQTGLLGPAVKGITALDNSLGQIAQAARSQGYALIVTADHGNAEDMVGRRGMVHTGRTINDVPLIVVDGGERLRSSGTLADIAPTILHIMGIPVPEEMTGTVLLR